MANIAAINWYDQIKTFGTSVQPLWGTQASIGNDTRGHTTPSGTYYPPDSNDGVLNTNSAISTWGPATGGPAFRANIAGDSGTDPRSIAWGLYTVTPNNFYFHNWIYNTTSITATYDFASDFGPAHGLNDPISVTINQGQHSFVIQGVYATGDPSAGGAVVDAIVTWDPLVGSPYGSYNSTNPQLYSRDTWLNYVSPRGNVYWAKPYDTNNPAVSFQDPEPSTPIPYYNAPTQYVAIHWNNRWVTIEQDTVTRCHGSPDIAYDENGNEVPHNGAAYCP